MVFIAFLFPGALDQELRPVVLKTVFERLGLIALAKDAAPLAGEQVLPRASP
jgi:hypothetical protein